MYFYSLDANQRPFQALVSSLVRCLQTAPVSSEQPIDCKAVEQPPQALKRTLQKGEFAYK